MSTCQSRLSLYWLDDHESFLGAQRCVRPSTSWLPFSSDISGTLSLGTAHFFFDDGGSSIVVFPLRYVEDATLNHSSTEFTLTFVCRRVLTRLVLPCTETQSAIPGVGVPLSSGETWVFRLPCPSEWFVEAARRLVHRQHVEHVLLRREIALQAAPSAVTFRVRRQVPMREQRGVLFISASQVTFEPLFAMTSHGTVTLPKKACVHSFARWIVFEAVGLDVYTAAEPDVAPALSLLFSNTQERDQARNLLHHLLGVPPYTASPHAMADAWKRGDVTNYDYLLHLNKWASRCWNDVFQYPVFPWVVADYDSPQLDLAASSTFRDLSKPIGALSEDRLSTLRERAQFLDAAEEHTYLYSTHYSSAGVVAYYLVRPHPEFQLCLQGGTLDVAERLMESIAQVWRSVSTNTSNFRELIPAFFNDDFAALCGPPRIGLGAHSSGRPVRPCVELPPWAADADDFVRQHRNALESDHVSQQLHLWIDLVFGAAQRGAAAQAASNLFHPFSYPQWTRKQQMSVPGLHLSPHEYAREFGNVPIQLFSDVHPPRSEGKRGVQCTAEALGTCGGGGGASGSADEASTSPRHQQLSEMIESLQTFDEETEEAGWRTDVRTLDTLPCFTPQEVTLVEVSTTPLPCASARFVALGAAGEDVDSAVLLVVGDDGRTVTLFRATSGERLRSFPDFKGQTTAVANSGENMLVFTDHHACYLISLTSLAVVDYFTELPTCSVTYACFSGEAVLLADTDAQLVWWDATPRASTPQLPFDFTPSVVCEASSRILRVGASTQTCTAVAVSAQLEVFMFHACVVDECILRSVPEEAEVLNIASAEQPQRFWVFFRAEATLYNDAGVWLRRLPFPGVSAVVCAHVKGHLCPLCVHSGRLPLEIRVLRSTKADKLVQLQYCRSVFPCMSLVNTTLAFVGRTTSAESTSPLVLTLAKLCVADSN